MLPWIYEFRWDAGHVVFIGAFLLLGAVIVTTLGVVAWRTRRRLQEPSAAHPGRAMP
jgi:hypothetical protein